MSPAEPTAPKPAAAVAAEALLPEPTATEAPALDTAVPPLAPVAGPAAVAGTFAPEPVTPDAAGPVVAARATPPAPTQPPVVADVAAHAASEPTDGAAAPRDPSGRQATDPTPTGNGHATDGHAPVAMPPALGFDAAPAGCTTAQMRRFIKSRPWIPMHELRRRFGINGHEDDVTGVSVGSRVVFVGLPEREGRMLGELLRGGDVGYELSVDPVTPIVIGVFPMRPVARI